MTETINCTISAGEFFQSSLNEASVYRGNVWPQSRGFRLPSCCAIPRNCIPFIYRWWLKRWMGTFYHHSPRGSSGGLGECLFSCVPLPLCFCSTQSGQMTLDIYCPLLSLQKETESNRCESVDLLSIWYQRSLVLIVHYDLFVKIHR